MFQRENANRNFARGEAYYQWQQVHTVLLLDTLERELLSPWIAIFRSQPCETFVGRKTFDVTSRALARSRLLLVEQALFISSKVNENFVYMVTLIRNTEILRPVGLASRLATIQCREHEFLSSRSYKSTSSRIYTFCNRSSNDGTTTAILWSSLGVTQPRKRRLKDSAIGRMFFERVPVENRVRTIVNQNGRAAIEV